MVLADCTIPPTREAQGALSSLCRRWFSHSALFVWPFWLKPSWLKFIVIDIVSPHRFGGMPRQWRYSNSRWWQHRSWKHSHRPLTHRKHGMRGERTKTPNSDFKPFTLPFDSTREPHRGSEDGSHRRPPAQRTGSTRRTAATQLCRDRKTTSRTGHCSGRAACHRETSPAKDQTSSKIRRKPIALLFWWPRRQLQTTTGAIRTISMVATKWTKSRSLPMQNLQ